MNLEGKQNVKSKKKKSDFSTELNTNLFNRPIFDRLQVRLL